ncbi:hypothetical protein CR513_19652, partial [Mucuna pruriens]
MVAMFINTLLSQYYDRVVGNVASNFAELVAVDERIKLGIRRGRFAQASGNKGLAKKPTTEKKKGEANAVMGASPSYMARYANPPPALYGPPRTNIGIINPRLVQQGTRRKPQTLTPIPMSYIELLPQLLEQKLMEIIPLKPLEPPYPRSYDPNARCDYHGGAVGHATERCWSLKHKVQDLLDGGLLDFQDQGPNIQSNPLPTYRGIATQ